MVFVESFKLFGNFNQQQLGLIFRGCNSNAYRQKKYRHCKHPFH